MEESTGTQLSFGETKAVGSSRVRGWSWRRAHQENRDRKSNETADEEVVWASTAGAGGDSRCQRAAAELVNRLRQQSRYPPGNESSRSARTWSEPGLSIPLIRRVSAATAADPLRAAPDRRGYPEAYLTAKPITVQPGTVRREPSRIPSQTCVARPTGSGAVAGYAGAARLFCGAGTTVSNSRLMMFNVEPQAASSK